MTMKKQVKHIGIAMLASLGLLGTGNNAQAVTGATTLTVSVPAFLVLYYPTALKVNLYDASTATATANVESSENAGGTIDDPTLALTVSSANNYSSKTINIPKVWAIRGITNSGTASVSIALNNATLTESANNSPSKTITVSAPKINNSSANETITLTGMTPVYGSVTMTLDLSNLNGAKAGNFVGTSPTYTITATAI